MAAMPTDLGMAAACVLAATFAWAGAAKLARRADTAAGFAALGLRRAPALAGIVPAVELLLAVTLLAAPSAGGAAALVLLAGFSAVLVRALRRGVEVRCACFGQAAGPSLSYVDLVRNGLLASLALLAVGAGVDPRVPAAAAMVVVGVATLAGSGALRLLRGAVPGTAAEPGGGRGS